jgi:ABC-type transport system involved in cytochrome c biogenesis ATPase subunit
MTSHLGQGGMIVAATHLDLGLAEARQLRLGAEALT